MNPSPPVPARFDRCQLDRVPLERRRAHGGQGEIDFCRIAAAPDVDGALDFLDLAVLAPGVGIGLHRHGTDEEEYYLVLSGQGTMTRDGERFRVESGALVRNRPGGEHSLVNDGSEELRLFVFQVRTRA